MRKLLLILIITTSFVSAQSKDADAIINNVKSTFSTVKDYIADVTITPDISFIKVPEMSAKIYFKQPDKVHFESKGFAMLPRNGMFTSPLSFLGDDYTAIYVNDVDLDGIKTSIVKVIPLNDKGNLILTTLWIDQKNNVIRKVEASTKTNGTFTLMLNYDSKIQYPLPRSMVFSFNMPAKGPLGKMRSRINENSDKESPDMLKGKITIDYKKYTVNKGIPDSVFKEEQSKYQYRD